MPEDDNGHENPLRVEAERRLHQRRFTDLVDQLEPAALIQELRVHQQELQLQNEHLQEILHELYQEREQYQTLYLRSPAAHFTINPAGEIISVNPTGCALLNVDETQLLKRRFALFITPGQRLEFSQSLQHWLNTPSGAPQQFKLDRLDGTHVHVQLRAIRLNGKEHEPRCLLALMDITALIEAQSQLQRLNSTLEARVQERTLQLEHTNAQLHHQAFHDDLTGLPNRLAFMRELDAALPSAHQQAFGVLYCDVDRFKIINDSLGHPAGDQVLVELARRLNEVVRLPDRIARLGGDEFALLLHDAHDESAIQRVASRLELIMHAPFLVRGHELYLTLSTGMLVINSDDHSPEDVLRDVDIAMYHAKRTGHGQVQLFMPEMREGLRERLTLESQVRQAVNRQELRVLYQPLVSLANGTLLGVEALVRWDHPQRGLLEPAVFIPLAEESGLIHAIDQWVVQECSRHIRSWQQRGVLQRPLWMNVNVSARHIGDVQNAMEARADADPGGVWIWQAEITERVVGEWRAGDETLLTNLRGVGVRLVVDDFGTGYSSLSMLRRFPVGMLKIDRSFIAGLDEHAELVRGMVLMGEAMGMTVVAEGVETREQQQELLRLGVKVAQGFLFAPALTPTQIEAYDARHPTT